MHKLKTGYSVPIGTCTQEMICYLWEQLIKWSGRHKDYLYQIDVTVQNILFDGWNTCISNIIVFISDKAPEFGTNIIRGQFKTQGCGISIAAGEVFKSIRVRSLAQPLVTQTTFRCLHDEGSSIAYPAIVIIRLVDDGKLRIKPIRSWNRTRDRQLAWEVAVWLCSP